ncbi:HNH endonuclease [Oecophyllibacter saccharovorans]|uniref:HNH endonuclease n=1 Tax=Oecophyllibacter saccharovorans TaxID=2558360 RepID=UPI001143CFB2|nr:HNH endonuclease signature motif containing protein [Oecophyllibacter saccharovorans]QDH15029.1 HNH endonuclease [Oecophyllibacter saccharovorans]
MTQRKAIPAETKLRLFSEASGHCQNPDCLEPLFPVELGGAKHIAEMAHVVPHGEAGPRREDRPNDSFDPDVFENLILLCPTCHTKIDKDPASFPRNILLDWKENHLANLATKQGIRAYVNRCIAREAIAGFMAENKAIWNRFAPEHGTDFNYDPESEVAKGWSKRMRSVILPNNYRIQAIIRANLGLATEDERRIFAEFQEHVRGLAERHVCNVSGRAIRFPKAMEDMFL